MKFSELLAESRWDDAEEFSEGVLDTILKQVVKDRFDKNKVQVTDTDGDSSYFDFGSENIIKLGLDYEPEDYFKDKDGYYFLYVEIDKRGKTAKVEKTYYDFETGDEEVAKTFKIKL